MSKTLTTPECRSQLNATCFGRCLEAIKVTQLGPVHNLTSVAKRPLSPFWPPRSQDKRPCHCGRGIGLYSANTRSALWYFQGPTEASPPRVLNASVEEGGDGRGSHLVVVRHAGLGGRSCPFVFEVASGLVMGVKSAGGSPSPHADFPIWATILLSIAGVLLLSGMAFLVIKLRSGPASPSSSSSSSSSSRRRASNKEGGGGSRTKVRVRATVEKEEEVASLKDPLLLGEEGKANDGGK